MGQPSVMIVIPTYSHFEYAIRAVRTALENTRTFKPYVAVVDDASPERLAAKIHTYDTPYGDYLFNLKYVREEYGDDRLLRLEFDQNGGLTRSWNAGLDCAKFTDLDACCVTNSDVVFPPGWDTDIFIALNSDKYALVGPTTNAPGTNPEQYVGRYSVLYDPKKKDSLTHMSSVQDEVRFAQVMRFKETTLNGFCMVAWTKTWWDNAYDDGHVFRPRNDFNSKGEPNPTPLMTLQEYELQRRWHAKGLKSAVCLGSYVYHYRAVSRGDRHKKGDWCRISGEGAGMS